MQHRQYEIADWLPSVYDLWNSNLGSRFLSLKHMVYGFLFTSPNHSNSLYGVNDANMVKGLTAKELMVLFNG